MASHSLDLYSESWLVIIALIGYIFSYIASRITNKHSYSYVRIHRVSASIMGYVSVM